MAGYWTAGNKRAFNNVNADPGWSNIYPDGVNAVQNLHNEGELLDTDFGCTGKVSEGVRIIHLPM